MLFNIPRVPSTDFHLRIADPMYGDSKPNAGIAVSASAAAPSVFRGVHFNSLLIERCSILTS